MSNSIAIRLRPRRFAKFRVTSEPYKIMIVAGEASGDLHAAKLATLFARMHGGGLRSHCLVLRGRECVRRRRRSGS